MITLNSKEDVQNSDVPFFVSAHVLGLLGVYETESLEKYGGVCWVEKPSDLFAYYDKPVEFAEIIMTGEGNVWHATFVHNNDYSTDVYVPEYLMDERLRNEWRADVVRTVYEDEFH